MALYKTGNPVPSSAMPDVWDNNRVQDEILNSEELEVETRTGIMTPTWKGVLKKNEDEIEETRQNLIPLSRQYMTLEAAQADIANIPEGSTTYYRSPDDSALAIEVMNVGGTLQPTGRKMPSQKAVDDIAEQTQQATDWLQRIYLGQQSQTTAISDTADKSNANEAMLQRIYLAQQLLSCAVNEVSGLPDTVPVMQLDALMTISTLGGALAALDGF
ncbi:hypothetical protein POW95_17390, partial [Klebsiella pneumoniae]